MDEIPWGAVVVVEEWQRAVFFRDGKVYDVLGPGEHVLTTAKIPLLSKIIGAVAKKAFKSHVIFVSLKQFSGKFGGRGQTVDPAPVQFRGEYLFRVEDPVLFVNEIVGGQSAYTTNSVERTLRMFFNQWVIDTLGEYKVTVYDVVTKTIETANVIKAALQDKFKRIGLELIDVALELSVPEEWQKKAFWLKQVREGGAAAAEVMRMETLREVAPHLAQAPGAGIGVGMALVPSLVAPTQPVAQPAAVPVAAQRPATIACPKCGFQNPAGAKFCANCGAPLQAQPAGGVVCPKCGFQNPAGAKFCANCGAPLQAAPTKCPKCGADVPTGAKFCPSCGAQIG